VEVDSRPFKEKPGISTAETFPFMSMQETERVSDGQGEKGHARGTAGRSNLQHTLLDVHLEENFQETRNKQTGQAGRDTPKI